MAEILNKTVLVTGGAGFIGSHVCDLLITKGAQKIIVLDDFSRGSLHNLENAMKSGIVDVVNGDIADLNVVKNTVGLADICFHMAAIRITRCASDPDAAFETMYKGFYNVFVECAEKKVEKVVFASSASIYGMADLFPTPETHHPYNNRTLYGASKLAGELMARSFTDMFGLEYIALRFFNVYGIRMDVYGKYTEVLIKWYHSIRKGERPKIFGDGKQSMDFVNVEDTAEACVKAMLSDSTDKVINVARGEEVTLTQLCETMIRIMGSGIEPEYVDLPAQRKKVEVLRRKADTTLAKEEIGFEAKISLEKGLGKLVGWLDSKEKGAF